MSEPDRVAHLESQVLAQSYFLELLLAGHLLRPGEPAENIEWVRSAMETQIRRDLRETMDGSDEPIPIERRAMLYIHALLDRVADQLNGPTAKNEITNFN